MVQDLEKSPEVRKMLEFESLPPNIKTQIQQEWDQVYKDARSSKQALLYKQMSAAIKSGDGAEIAAAKALADELRPISGSYPASYPDPMSFGYGSCGAYKSMKRKIEIIEAEYSDYGDTSNSKAEEFAKFLF